MLPMVYYTKLKPELHNSVIISKPLALMEEVCNQVILILIFTAEFTKHIIWLLYQLILSRPNMQKNTRIESFANFTCLYMPSVLKQMVCTLLHFLTINENFMLHVFE